MDQPCGARNRCDLSCHRTRACVSWAGGLRWQGLGFGRHGHCASVSRRKRCALPPQQRCSEICGRARGRTTAGGVHPARQQWAADCVLAVLCGGIRKQCPAQSRSADLLSRLLVTVLHPRVTRHSGATPGIPGARSSPRRRQRGPAGGVRGVTSQGRLHVYVSVRSAIRGHSPVRSGACRGGP